MKKLIALILALVMMMSVMSFAAADDATVITFQMAGEPQCLDPTMNDYSTSNYVLQNTFRGLYKSDENGVLVPALAESYTVSDDGLVYTFTLKPDLKWSDGSPLTAADFEYSWKRVLDPNVGSETAYTMYNVVKDGYACFVDKTVTIDELPIKAIDDLTLEVTLASPMSYFLSLTACAAFMPVKKDVVEAFPGAEDWTIDPSTYVCNGPFMLTEKIPDVSYTLVKNPNYYNADEIKIDEIKIVFIDAAETTKMAFDNGEVDVAISVSTDAIAQYTGTENLKLQSRIGYRYFEFNCGKEPFNDIRVRQALNIALDRDYLVNGVLGGHGYAPLFGWVPFNVKDVADSAQQWRDIYGNAFNEDLEAAKALLAEAGYPNGEGFPAFSICYASSSTETATLAEAMAEIWSTDLGLTVTLEAVESYWADEAPRAAGTYDVAYMGYTVDYDEPSAAYFILENANNDQKTRWDCPAFLDLCNTMRTNLTVEDREAVYVEAEQLLAVECPVIPIYNYVACGLVSSRIDGMLFNANGHPIFEYCTLK